MVKVTQNSKFSAKISSCCLLYSGSNGSPLSATAKFVSWSEKNIHFDLKSNTKTFSNIFAMVSFKKHRKVWHNCFFFFTIAMLEGFNIVGIFSSILNKINATDLVILFWFHCHDELLDWYSFHTIYSWIINWNSYIGFKKTKNSDSVILWCFAYAYLNVFSVCERISLTLVWTGWWC